MTRRLARLLCPVIALLAFPGAVSANEFDDFQKARQAYETLDYTTAVDLFESLVGGEVPRLTNPPLILESRKYLAASYLFVGKADRAERQIEALLRQEPGYVLDPLAFPAELQALFEKVQARLAEERAEADAAAKRAAVEEEKRSQARAAVDRQRMQRLVQLAKTERVEEVRSRWIALIPFGVGQFHNGHEGLGLVLAVAEGTLLATSVVSFLVHEDLRDEPTLNADQLDDAEFAEAAWRLTNNISTGLFAVLAVTGIIDAQARFKETRSYDRERPLPPELESIEVGVIAGPGGVALHGRF